MAMLPGHIATMGPQRCTSTAALACTANRTSPTPIILPPEAAGGVPERAFAILLDGGNASARPPVDVGR